MTIQLRGHLMDSLTLTKVFDRILTQGGRYELNDLTVAVEKQDISNAILTLMADDEAQLQTIYESLQPYGAQRQPHQAYQTAPASADGQCPPDAYQFEFPPTLTKGPQGWLPIDTAHCEVVMRVAPDSGGVSLVSTHQIKAGDLIVIGRPAIKPV